MKILKDLLYEHGKLSIGRTLLFLSFICLLFSWCYQAVAWVKILCLLKDNSEFNKYIFDAPESLLGFIYAMLAYVLGGKLKDIFKKDDSKQKPQE